MKQTITYENKKLLKEYEIELTVETSIDNNDGADRDGNRGRIKESVNGIEILSVKNSEGMDLMERLSKKVLNNLYDYAWGCL
jgi:hypothetical protein